MRAKNTMSEKRKKNGSKKSSSSRSQKSANKKVSLRKQKVAHNQTSEDKSIRTAADLINTWGFPLISISVASFVCLYITIQTFRSATELGSAKWIVLGVVFMVWIGYVGSSIWTIRKRQKKKVLEEEIW